MEYVKIFLASSVIQFHNERLEISDCIRALNDRYVDRGIYFKLFICEDESDMLSLSRKQDEYNKEIEKSDYFYMFVANRLGQYTLEEFNVALDHFRETLAPQIYTYFYQIETADQFCKGFMKKLDEELGHYYNAFSNIDSVKLHMLMELISDPRVNGKAVVEFRNGVASVDSVPMVQLDKVPAFNNNKALQDNIRKLKDLNEKFARLAIEFSKAPQDTGLLEKLSENTKERNELENRIHESEKLLFDLMKMTCDRKPEGSWRTQQALIEIEAGNYEGALNILRDAQRSVELNNAEEKVRQAEEIKKAAMTDISNYIEENLLRIRTIKLSKRGNSRSSEVAELYEENLELLLKYGTGEESALDYLDYLLAHNQNRAVIKASKKIRDTETALKPWFVAAALNKEGCALTAMNRLDEAEATIAEALQIVKRAGHDDENRQILTEITYNYGNVLFALNDYEQAGEYFISAYDLLESSGDVSREVIEKLAWICISLGSLSSDLNKRVEAEEYYLKAMDLMDRLAEPSENEVKNRAVLYNNLSVLAVQRNDIEKAEHYMDLSLRAVAEGEETDPAEFLIYRSMALLNGGMIDFRKGDYVQAGEKMEEALRIREMLYEEEQETFDPLIAVACHDLGMITAMQEDSADNEYFDRAESIEKALTEKNSEVFQAYCVITKTTRTSLDIRRTTEDLKECIRLSEKLVETLSPAYRSYVGMALLNMGVTLYQRGDKKGASEYLHRAYDTYTVISRFTGEKNKGSSYEDVLLDIQHDLDIIERDSPKEIAGIWYMELFEIWNGQITGMPVRNRIEMH